MKKWPVKKCTLSIFHLHVFSDCCGTSSSPSFLHLPAGPTVSHILTQQFLSVQLRVPCAWTIGCNTWDTGSCLPLVALGFPTAALGEIEARLSVRGSVQNEQMKSVFHLSSFSRSFSGCFFRVESCSRTASATSRVGSAKRRESEKHLKQCIKNSIIDFAFH